MEFLIIVVTHWIVFSAQTFGKSELLTEKNLNPINLYIHEANSETFQ